MTSDVRAVAEFYATARGAVAARLLRERLGGLWPDLHGQSILGLGYAAPYLRLWRETAYRSVALTPSQLGASRWPMGAANLSCMADEDALPFPGQSFDRILVVHGLETAEHNQRMLREIWRILRDDGKLLIVAPNRRGLWAHTETTPFGQGQPYSPRQINHLLAASMFRTERCDSALFLPPVNLRLVLRSGPIWERAGRRLAPQLAGVTLTEAVKDVHAVMPLRATTRRVLAPVNAT